MWRISVGRRSQPQFSLVIERVMRVAAMCECAWMLMTAENRARLQVVESKLSP